MASPIAIELLLVGRLCYGSRCRWSLVWVCGCFPLIILAAGTESPRRARAYGDEDRIGQGGVCMRVREERECSTSKVAVGGACANDECKDEFGSGLIELPEVLKIQ